MTATVTEAVTTRDPGKRRARPRSSAAPIRYVVLGVVALPWVVLPLWILVVNSFKTQGDASIPSIDLPKVWNAAANYADVITKGQYFVGLGNSLLLAVPAIAVVLLLGTMAAWSYARSNARSLRFAYFATSLSMILPPAIIPTVYILINLDLNGTRLGYFLTIVGTRLGVVIFLSTGFVKTMSPSLEEAALMDGANRWQVYWHIVLPLLRPVMFTAAILLFISIWNDFFFALFLLPGQDQATLPLDLYRFATTSTSGVAWNLVFADVVLTGLPLFIAYIVLQRRVLGGLTEGSVTG
jgi:raffinose/stachyose/melibiose transport system permease protein